MSKAQKAVHQERSAEFLRMVGKFLSGKSKTEDASLKRGKRGK